MSLLVRLLILLFGGGFVLLITRRLGRKGIAIAAIAVLIVAASSIWTSISRHRASSTFEGHLAGFLADTALARSDSGAPTAVGRLLVLDANTQTVHEWQHLLPDELRARTPDDVGTVVLVRHDSSVVGHYAPSGGPAIVHLLSLTFVEHLSQKVLGTRTFHGSAPPSSVPGSAGAGASGSVPNSLAISFLVTMPRTGTSASRGVSPPAP